MADGKPPAKYKDVRVVVTHDGCADGVASALLLHDALPDARIEFVQYGTTKHAELKPEPGMLFCDITPPRKRMQEFVDAGALVLDHHKHAKDISDAFGDNAVFADEKTEPGVAGAVLAWREVWEPTYGFLHCAHLAKEFAELAGVYDTWQTQDKRWMEARVQTEVLKFFPPEIWLAKSDPFHDDSDTRSFWQTKLEFGRLLIQKHEQKVHAAVRGSYRFTTGKGTRVIVFEGTTLTSIAAEIVDQEADLIVGFNYYAENFKGKMIASTRSHTGYDCGALCKSYGGGGHTAAAGCVYEFDLRHNPREGSLQGAHDPYFTVLSLIERYEDPNWSE